MLAAAWPRTVPSSSPHPLSFCLTPPALCKLPQESDFARAAEGDERTPGGRARAEHPSHI